jgi:hypothetical protein
MCVRSRLVSDDQFPVNAIDASLDSKWFTSLNRFAAMFAVLFLCSGFSDRFSQWHGFVPFLPYFDANHWVQLKTDEQNR